MIRAWWERRRHRREVQRLIRLVRMRSHDAGYPLDHLTDWEINRDGVGLEYVWPEIAAGLVAANSVFRKSLNQFGGALNDAATAMEQLREAIWWATPPDDRNLDNRQSPLTPPPAK